MNERAIILLLEEWHRQLCDALDVARAAFPDPEPHRFRRWTPLAALNFSRVIREPSEDDPSDQWEWVEVPCTPPHLADLEATIMRIGDHIERLSGKAE